MVTVIPVLVTFSIFAGIIGAFCTCWFAGVMNAVDLEYGLQYMFVEWFIWAGIIKSLFFAFIIASVSAFFGYTVDDGSIAVGKASTDAVVSSSVLILFADLVLTKLSGEGAEAPLFSSFYLFSVLFNPSHLETFSEKVPE